MAQGSSDAWVSSIRPKHKQLPSSQLQEVTNAKRISDEIDKQLKADAAARRKPIAAEYRMLLLGQAGAGKTTVLKQMRLLYDPQTHQRERGFWRSIIHLNLISSLRILLQTLNGVLEGSRSNLSSEGREALQTLSLDPILSIEQALRRSLGAVGDNHHVNEVATSWRPRAWNEPCVSNLGDALLLRAGWQQRLLSLHQHGTAKTQTARAETLTLLSEECRRLLLQLQKDVVRLWSDPHCKKLRRSGKWEAVDATTYFLDSYKRISQSDYEPSDEDILHARVRTVGVTEDRFQVDRHLIYRIFDVGGSRSQRAAWASFFDDAQAIIFLAPISAFDQTLVEDPTVNRVQDSLTLFAKIAASELLKKAALILFLNKVDLLEEKLRQGVQLSTFFPEYVGDNNFEAIWRWFRTKFRGAATSNKTPISQRPIYVHTTVATSTKQIKAILMSVNDTILRDNLRATGLVG